MKRKNFVSDGLVTLRHKYVDEQLKALRGDEDVSEAFQNPGGDKDGSAQEQYQHAKNDLDIRLHEQLAALKCQIAEKKQSLNACEAAYDKFEHILKKFTNLPESTEITETADSPTPLEQLRVNFFRIKAGCVSMEDKKNSPSPQPTANLPQISLLPELNSLNQTQMFKMGLCFALPLIIGILAGCAIIAWVIVFTLGR